MGLATVVLVLLATATMLQGYRFNFDDDFKEFDEWQRGVPSSGKLTELNKCRRDILIVWDLSLSITGPVFENNVRPFIKEMIRDPQLNVGPDGTHIAIIVFSQLDKTRLLFNFGTYDTQSELIKAIDEIDWKKVGSGSYTETARALKIANKLVFPKKNPLNGNPHVDDVMLLFTDGAPRFKKYTPEGEAVKETIQEIDILKGKDVRVITMGTGRANSRGELQSTAEMRDFLKVAATSPKDAFEAAFDKLPTVIKSLVDASCKKFQRGDCSCNAVGSKPHYMAATQPDIEVDWLKPGLKCKTGKTPESLTTTVTPDLQPPAKFKAGHHVITYNYTIQEKYTVSCNVDITVKACQCQDVPSVLRYVGGNSDVTSVAWQVPKPDCKPSMPSTPLVAMPQDFKVGKHKVTYKYILDQGSILTCDVNVEVKVCQCQQQASTVAYVGVSGKASVSWKIPKPECDLSLSSTKKVAMPQSLSAGKHIVTYEYRLKSGAVLTCPVYIEVKECFCPTTQNIVKHVKPQSPYEAPVKWSIPKPCPDAKLLSVLPKVAPGDVFKRGKQTILYKYGLPGGAQLTCRVDVEIKVIPCQGQDYDPTSEVCCCGKAWPLKAGWKCCGRKYYDAAVDQCCSVNWNLAGKNDQCLG